MSAEMSISYIGGAHAETAAFANLLAAQNVHAGEGKALSEAMLLGIGGGLGAGYILWEFREHHAKVLVFGWRNRWQYTTQFYEVLCSRLGAVPTFLESGSPKIATQQLKNALRDGRRAIAWVDRAHLPYLHLPASLQGHIGHIVGVIGMNDDSVLLDDLAAKPFQLTSKAFAAARKRITSYKHRLLTVDTQPVAQIDLPAAVRAGIEDCVTHLSSSSDSFSLPTFRKWGRMMTDRKNAKGWPVVFADRRGLYSALKSVYEGVELISPTGGGLRGLYADFLAEAADVLQLPPLHQVEGHYRALAAQWSAFARLALPDHILPLRQTRELLQQRHTVYMQQGGSGEAEYKAFTEQLNTLYAELNADFSLSDDEVNTLFDDMGAVLLALYDAEKNALAALKNIVAV